MMAHLHICHDHVDGETLCARPHSDINCGLILSFDLCTLQPASEHGKPKRCAAARKAVGPRGGVAVAAVLLVTVQSI